MSNKWPNISQLNPPAPPSRLIDPGSHISQELNYDVNAPGGSWQGELKTLGWHTCFQLCTSLCTSLNGAVPKPESPFSVPRMCGRPPKAAFNCGRSKKSARAAVPCQPGPDTSAMALPL